MADGPIDPRMTFLEQKVCGLLRAKPELFQKLVASEEEGDKVRRFVNDDSCMTIFFQGGAKEMTVYLDQPPPHNKKKVAFVQKTGEHKLDEKKPETWFDQVVTGDLNAPLLESMHGMLRNVYLPIISNPKNTQGWPEVAMKSFADEYQRTLAAVVVAMGQTKGKTLLALPPSESLGGGAKGGASNDRQDKDRVHVLESAVVMWTERINTALSRSPDSSFANDQHPGPLVGLDFWTTKMTDLGEILDQLNGPQIQKVKSYATSSSRASATRLDRLPLSCRCALL